MDSMTVLMTSFHQRDFTVNCIKTYQKFCPDDFDMTILVVETSDDISYKDEVLALGDNIEWVNDNTTLKGTDAYTHGIDFGMEHIKDEYVFLSHNDVAITSDKFFESIREKADEGYYLVGTCADTHPKRNHSIIILGALVKSQLVRDIDLYQKPRPDGTPHFEAGDRLHLHCKENNLKHMCYLNTHNNPEIIDHLSEPYKSLDYTVRVLADREIIFLHFARGTTKTHGKYTKAGRMTVPQVVEWCNKHIL